MSAGADRSDSLRSARAHLFVRRLDRPEVEPFDRHHVERVLRLRPGEPVTVSDGNGRWAACSWGPVLEPVGEVVLEDRPDPPVTVGFAVPKGDRPEWATQKLVELGVDRIVLLHAARSVVRWTGERSVRHRQRLRRVAREAAMQARRTWLPQVEGPIELDEVLGWEGVALAGPGGAPPSLERPVVLVGPEGGWTPEEWGRRPAAVGLGPQMLRVETAAMAAATLLLGLRARLVGPVAPEPTRDAAKSAFGG
jgi:16S rRNA (uracil1498-N3)-methyltransferase